MATTAPKNAQGFSAVTMTDTLTRQGTVDTTTNKSRTPFSRPSNSPPQSPGLRGSQNHDLEFQAEIKGKGPSEKLGTESIYWDEPEPKYPFPFLYRPTVPFPTKMCGKKLPFIMMLTVLLIISLAAAVVAAAAAASFSPAESSRVYKFLKKGANQYVGDDGITFYVMMLLTWSMITGYFLLRTGNLDLFGFFHLLAPPGLGMATIGLFDVDFESIFWGQPITNPDMYYTLAVFVPLLTLGLGYFLYFTYSKNIQPQVLYDTLSWPKGYWAATFVTFAKFAFSGLLEEIGWSGVLFPQLLHATESYIMAAVLGGIIWGLWHAPLIIGGGYNNNIHPLWAAWMLPWMTTGWAFFHLWLRVRSFSIWPVVLAHVSHNCFLELFFDPLVGRSEYRGFSKMARKKRAHYFVGEFGKDMCALSIYNM
ncbi:hypothetical protein AAMO2058_000636500 [Amorphochlora amoebiformis]